MDNKLSVPDSGEKESFIVCRNSQGIEVRATPLRLSRFAAAFEVYNPYSILQLSEVLSDFKIIMNDRMVYSGRGVVSSLVNTGLVLVCEATLDESWLDVDLFAPVNRGDRLQAEFRDFIREWGKIQTVAPEFKVVVADMQSLLVDLKRWMEQVELSIRSQPAGDRIDAEKEVVKNLREPFLPLLSPVFGRFEEICETIVEELRPAHRTYVKRQLHPVVLCAPFCYRAYRKPLGYAGDYEMVNMMLRDPMEGSSLFAKILNLFFLNTPPVTAHRNRISYLTEVLREETTRVANRGRPARIFNLGCGPAQEIQRFLQLGSIADQAEFHLLDFNDETLQFTGQTLEQLKRQLGRATPVRMIKKSVHQILKEASKPNPDMPVGSFDLVYCAGLFDYLSDRICKRLMDIFYELVAPGGLLVATNVDSSNPSRNWMEYVVEWHLVYRDKKLLTSLIPESATPDMVTIKAEALGVNIFVEVRKPEHA
ncbi:MAG: class I SAM-dependent methyltransferase [Candidatus Omnitrophica bacterium]|nr:class I SAM-dependent methyltransferase [Candidatus Omnitrophota bacterium]